LKKWPYNLTYNWFLYNVSSGSVGKQARILKIFINPA
jgi:hypothetical protein